MGFLKSVNSFIPRRYWRVLREGSLALVCAWVVGTEIRDMYERSQWEQVGLQGTTTILKTGDVVLIANRWFTMPTWKQVGYSLFMKGMMKTTWDDCGIIICDPNDNYRPYILIAEYEKVVMCRFDEFCEVRQPRGVAIRSLLSPDPEKGVRIPNMAGLEQHVRELLGGSEERNSQEENNNSNNSNKQKEYKGRRTTPWYLISAAWQKDNERAQYRWAIESSELAFEIQQKRATNAATEKALAKLTDQLHDRLAMADHYEQALRPEPEKPYKKLTNASLVTECLQEAGLLTKPFPLPYRYTPVDLAWRIPLINVSLTQPKMVYTS
jgi:hypothetical protein